MQSGLLKFERFHCASRHSLHKNGATAFITMHKNTPLLLLFLLGCLVISGRSFANEIFLICEGVTSSSIVDRDEQTRATVLRRQSYPDSAKKLTFILNDERLFDATGVYAIRGCKINKYSISCTNDSTRDAVHPIFHTMEINRLNGSISETLTLHSRGQINGIESISIDSTYFNGICKTTDRPAF